MKKTFPGAVERTEIKKNQVPSSGLRSTMTATRFEEFLWLYLKRGFCANQRVHLPKKYTCALVENKKYLSISFPLLPEMDDIGVPSSKLPIDELPDPGDRYKIGSKLGSGVGGKVYEATDTKTGTCLEKKSHQLKRKRLTARIPQTI